MASEIDVIVVDEDEDILDLTETFLERESDQISVTTEKHPPTAAERIENGDFDCVVSDLRMPEMDGIELSQHLSEQCSDLPFFLFTAADTDDIAAKSGSGDLTGIVQKGTGTDHYTDLAAQIETAVD
jgi:DNA-binding NtrC family response regulator